MRLQTCTVNHWLGSTDTFLQTLQCWFYLPKMRAARGSPAAGATRSGRARTHTGPGAARGCCASGRCGVEAVYVLGTHLWTDVYSAAPTGVQTFSLKQSERVRVEVVRDGQAEEVATNGKQRWPLSPSTTLRLTMSQASPEASSDKVTVSYYEEEGITPVDQAGLFLTAIGC
ncbi:hypothetical protein R6Z07M_008420 [Ovis aries]